MVCKSATPAWQNAAVAKGSELLGACRAADDAAGSLALLQAADTHCLAAPCVESTEAATWHTGS